MLLQITNDDGNRLEVCKKTFLSIFCIGEQRVKELAVHKWKLNGPRGENRGGARKNPDYSNLKEEIQKHISSFRCVSSHYGREKTPHKQYLPSNLMKMYKQFLKEYEGVKEVKYNYYYGVFVSSFNLGFGSPKTDVCSFCVKTKASIAITQDQARKKVLLTELLVQNMRAKKFYALLNEEQDDSVLTVCFDLMQNQALPKSPIGEAYYARQLWLYFLGIVVHRLNEQQRDDVFFIPGVNTSKREEPIPLPGLLLIFWKKNSMFRIIKLRPCVFLVTPALAKTRILLALNMLAAKTKVEFQHFFSSQGTLIHAY